MGVRMARCACWLVSLSALTVVGCRSAPALDPGSGLPEQPVATGSLVVENSSGQTIFGLQFARSGDPEWGWDRLGGGDVLKRGARRQWEVPVGTYRVRAELADGAVVEAGEDYPVGADEEAVCVVAEAGAEQVGILTLVNATGFAIAKVSFSLTSQMGWGEDRLGADEVLAPGKSRVWKVPAGRYNLRVQFQDGTSLEGRGAYEVVAGESAIYRLSN